MFKKLHIEMSNSIFDNTKKEFLNEYFYVRDKGVLKLI